MDKLTFGLTMMVVGIGGTFLTLSILIWSIQLLKKIFPLSSETGSKAKNG
ncbi:OadG-related small transporter subunit [Rhodoplanes sp. SY1]